MFNIYDRITAKLGKIKGNSCRGEQAKQLQCLVKGWKYKQPITLTAAISTDFLASRTCPRAQTPLKYLNIRNLPLNCKKIQHSSHFCINKISTTYNVVLDSVEYDAMAITVAFPTVIVQSKCNQRSCGRLSWLNCQLSSAPRYSIFTYLLKVESNDFSLGYLRLC